LQALPYQLRQTVNWKAILFWGILVGIGTFTAYSYRESIIAFIQSIPTRLSTFKLPDFSGFANGIIDYINKNPIAVIAAVASLCTAAVTLLSKFKANKEKNQALEEKAQVEQLANQNISSAQQTAMEYKTKYEDLLKNNPASSLQESLAESQSLVTSQQSKIQSLEGQIQALQDALLLKETKTVEKTVVK